eukprot:295281-Chlamydomonas_euryale.AAC.1
MAYAPNKSTTPLFGPCFTSALLRVQNLEVLFAGRICGGREEPVATWPNCPKGVNKGYSQGVRQLVHYHHWNRTGFSIMVSSAVMKS